MADKIFYEIQHRNVGIKILSFSFLPNGSSAVDQDSIKGRGIASVAWTATGKFTITLADSYVALMSASFLIAMTSEADLNPQIGAVDVVTAKTIKLVILAAGSGTDIASNAANRVYGTLFLRNSTVT